MSVLSKYIKTAGSGIVAKVVMAGSGVVVLFLLNQILDKAAFGNFMLAIAISKIISLVISSGFTRVLLFRISRMEEVGADENKVKYMLGTALTYGVVFALLASVGLYAVSGLVGSAASKPELSSWLFAGCIIVPCDVLRYIVNSWHRALQRVHTSIFFRDVSPAVLLPLVLAVFWFTNLLEFSPFTAGVTYAACYLLPSLFLLALHPCLVRPWSPAFSRGDVRYGLKMLLMQLTTQPARQVDILVVGFLATPEITAEYVLASRLAQFMMLSKNLFSQLLVPRMGYLLEHGDGKALKVEYDSARNASLFVALIIAGVYSAFAPQVLSVFGDYSASSTLLILVAAMLTRIAVGTSGSYLSMSGYAGWSLMTATLGLVVNLLLAILLVPTFGASGAATAFLLAVFAQNSFEVWGAWHLDQFKAIDWQTSCFLVLAILLLLTVSMGIIPGRLSAVGFLLLIATMCYMFRSLLFLIRRRLSGK